MADRQYGFSVTVAYPGEYRVPTQIVGEVIRETLAEDGWEVPGEVGLRGQTEAATAHDAYNTAQRVLERVLASARTAGAPIPVGMVLNVREATEGA